MEAEVDVSTKNDRNLEKSIVTSLPQRASLIPQGSHSPEGKAPFLAPSCCRLRNCSRYPRAALPVCTPTALYSLYIRSRQLTALVQGIHCRGPIDKGDTSAAETLSHGRCTRAARA